MKNQFIGKLTVAVLDKMPTATLTWKNRDEHHLGLTVMVVESAINFVFANDHTFLPAAIAPDRLATTVAEIADAIHEEFQKAVDQYRKPEVLRQFAIYDHPTDYPDHWIVRTWYVTDNGIKPDPSAVLCRSVERARHHIQKERPGAILIDANDPDPNLYEVWM
jgi:hypothetical protein